MKLSKMFKNFFVSIIAWSAIPGRKFDQSGIKGMIVTLLISIAIAIVAMLSFGQSEAESLIIFLLSAFTIGWFVWIAPAITKEWYRKEYLKADDLLRRYLTDDLICIYLMTGHSVAERVTSYLDKMHEQNKSIDESIHDLKKLSEEQNEQVPDRGETLSPDSQ